MLGISDLDYFIEEASIPFVMGGDRVPGGQQDRQQGRDEVRDQFNQLITVVNYDSRAIVDGFETDLRQDIVSNAAAGRASLSAITFVVAVTPNATA